MDANEHIRYHIDHIRCPVIEGLPEKTVRLLHMSMTEIERIQQSVECTQLQIGLSRHAAYESTELLSRLRREGFYP